MGVAELDHEAIHQAEGIQPHAPDGISKRFRMVSEKINATDVMIRIVTSEIRMRLRSSYRWSQKVNSFSGMLPVFFRPYTLPVADPTLKRRTANSPYQGVLPYIDYRNAPRLRLRNRIGCRNFQPVHGQP